VVYQRTRQQAIEQGWVWELTLKEFVEIRKNPCFYCGDVLPQTRGGLDRVDCNGGYTVANVLPACVDCNRHRGATWTVQEAKVAINAVKQFRGTHVSD
jgi:hypothetical protein